MTRTVYRWRSFIVQSASQNAGAAGKKTATWLGRRFSSPVWKLVSVFEFTVFTLALIGANIVDRHACGKWRAAIRITGPPAANG